MAMFPPLKGDKWEGNNRRETWQTKHEQRTRVMSSGQPPGSSETFRQVYREVTVTEKTVKQTLSHVAMWHRTVAGGLYDIGGLWPAMKNPVTDNPLHVTDAPRFTLCKNCGIVSGRWAKYCDECGAKLQKGVGAAKQEFTLELIIEMMYQHPLAAIVLCNKLCEGEAKLAPSPLLQKYFDEKER